MSTQPFVRISPSDLDSLMSTLEVKFAALSECLVSPGYILDMAGIKVPGIHYNLSGHGAMFIGNEPPIALKPHTLIIVPADSPFRIEVPDPQNSDAKPQVVDGRIQADGNKMLQRYIAGGGQPEIILICGFFHATYGLATDLFGTLSSPIVEQFEEGDRLDQFLKSALGELNNQRVGYGAMSASLLKLVIIALLRRSLISVNLWAERFSILSDPDIARAFSHMVANPGGAHTVKSLAKVSCISRSGFMAKFTSLFGQPPMAVLRDLRMRHAAELLKATELTMDEIARSVGYDSRSSFIRVFRAAYHSDPSDFRSDVAKKKLSDDESRFRG